MKHPVFLRGYETPNVLATAIFKLRYDALKWVFFHLSELLMNEACTELDRGRKRLARVLRNASQSARDLSVSFDFAMAISRPHMKDDLAESPEIDG